MRCLSSINTNYFGLLVPFGNGTLVLGLLLASPFELFVSVPMLLAEKKMSPSYRFMAVQFSIINGTHLSSKHQSQTSKGNVETLTEETNKQETNVPQKGVKRHSSRTDQSTSGRSLTHKMLRIKITVCFFGAAPVSLRLEYSPLGAVGSPSSELMMLSSNGFCAKRT